MKKVVDIKNNIKRNPAFIYIIIQVIIFQIFGAIAFIKYNIPKLNIMFTFMNIAVILSATLFFKTKVLNIKSKVLDALVEALEYSSYTRYVVFYDNK